jgi:hypothetical protein
MHWESEIMDANELVKRYVAMWNEPDEERRRAAVAELWAEDGAHFTEHIGGARHDAIAERIRRAFDRFARPGAFSFRALYNIDIDAHHCAIKFIGRCTRKRAAWRKPWASTSSCPTTDGLVCADYQFIEP